MKAAFPLGLCGNGEFGAWPKRNKMEYKVHCKKCGRDQIFRESNLKGYCSKISVGGFHFFGGIETVK